MFIGSSRCFEEQIEPQIAKTQTMVNNIIFYETPEGKIHVQVRFENETFWLTQKAMAALFGVEVPAISKHLKNIYSEGELSESTTVSKMETVVSRGFRGEVNEMIDFYNLDAIIAVGYRVNSKQATQFRIWATSNGCNIAVYPAISSHSKKIANGRHSGLGSFDTPGCYGGPDRRNCTRTSYHRCTEY